MAKLNWSISRPGYGHQFDVVANTRADAVAAAEIQFRQDMAWFEELVGQIDDEGNVITRPLTPDFVATKIGRA